MNDILENSNITSSTQSTMDIVFQATKRRLDALELGTKTTLSDLIDKVVAETGAKVSIVNGLVPMFVHDWARKGEGSINKGRNGGIFKGGKPRHEDTRKRCDACHQVLRTINIKNNDKL